MSRVPSYDPEAVETKWQERWERDHTNEPDLDHPERPFYNLMMFPYPSAEGLHVGNMFAFTGADIYGRFKRLQGYGVVANEQVINGYCERHPDTRVEQRYLEQWFFAITRYAQRLLENLDRLDWSDSTRTLQRNWIGRSEGAELVFETPAGAKITVYTTRPDTVFGATYLVLAPEHPLVDQLTADEKRHQVNAYRREVQGKDLVSRRVGDRTKTGVFLGSYARNPATGEAIPIWIADYVLMEYGTGAIMAVPAHDTRDFEFATQFKLPIREVVRTGGGEPLPSVTEDGVLVNSGEFDGLSCREAQRRIVAWLQAKGLATPQVQYRLHLGSGEALRLEPRDDATLSLATRQPVELP